MVEIRSQRHLQLEKTEPFAKVDNVHGGELNTSGVIGKDIVSADLMKATHVRAYREWPGEYRHVSALSGQNLNFLTLSPPDDSGALVNTYGVPLPVNYRLSELLGFEWICPIRTCGRVVSSLKSLGGHFSVRPPPLVQLPSGTLTKCGHNYLG